MRTPALLACRIALLSALALSVSAAAGDLPIGASATDPSSPEPIGPGPEAPATEFDSSRADLLPDSWESRESAAARAIASGNALSLSRYYDDFVAELSGPEGASTRLARAGLPRYSELDFGAFLLPDRPPAERALVFGEFPSMAPDPRRRWISPLDLGPGW